MLTATPDRESRTSLIEKCKVPVNTYIFRRNVTT